MQSWHRQSLPWVCTWLTNISSNKGCAHNLEALCSIQGQIFPCMQSWTGKKYKFWLSHRSLKVVQGMIWASEKPHIPLPVIFHKKYLSSDTPTTVDQLVGDQILGIINLEVGHEVFHCLVFAGCLIYLMLNSQYYRQLSIIGCSN